MSCLEWVGLVAVSIVSLRLTAWILGLLHRTIRDTLNYFHGAKLRPGYSRLNWLWMYPKCFGRRFKKQLAAWWNGYEEWINR